jgi:transcriptional regulator with XRE-family HTH domain
LIDEGLSVAGMARRLGWSRIYVSYVVNGQRTGRKAQERIAEILGVPVNRAFPSKGKGG